MPVKYIGRVTEFKGKTLLDILCRLKKFGVGRMVYRNKFHERYPEPSYYVITKVDAYMKGDPTLRVRCKSIGRSEKNVPLALVHNANVNNIRYWF